MSKKRRKSISRGKFRMRTVKYGLILVTLCALWGTAAEWYVHHSQKWLRTKDREWPQIVTAPLLWLGNPLADVTDGLGWTGHDAVYEYDTDAPANEIFFAGAPRRVGEPAPSDITILDRGHFKIGWSNRLRHPVWCAYHVTPQMKYELPKRPGFTKDKSVSMAPRPDDYARSGYDRGHMAPNFAIATRYGEEFQRLTFMMSNISPQSPALNRGVWRDVEHRIAELWTARYGEIWVVVGCVPSTTRETIDISGIDIPEAYFQVIMAQEGMDVRALAMYFPQTIPWNAWAARHIITIDELEQKTGLDFNPDLPQFIQEPLESELPTRLWPVCSLDIIRQVMIRYMK